MDIIMQYIRLYNRVDALIANGINDLDPVCRSIYRQLVKLYRRANAEDRRAMDFITESDLIHC